MNPGKTVYELPVCATYSRYSSEGQNANSVADQQRALRDFAKRETWQAPPELEFGDEAISGTKRDRPGLQASPRAVLPSRSNRQITILPTRPARIASNRTASGCSRPGGTPSHCPTGLAAPT